MPGSAGEKLCVGNGCVIPDRTEKGRNMFCSFGATLGLFVIRLMARAGYAYDSLCVSGSQSLLSFFTSPRAYYISFLVCIVSQSRSLTSQYHFSLCLVYILLIYFFPVIALLLLSSSFILFFSPFSFIPYLPSLVLALFIR